MNPGPPANWWGLVRFIAQGWGSPCFTRSTLWCSAYPTDFAEPVSPVCPCPNPQQTTSVLPCSERSNVVAVWCALWCSCSPAAPSVAAVQELVAHSKTHTHVFLISSGIGTLLLAEGTWPIQGSSGLVGTEVLCVGLGLWLSWGNFWALATGLGEIPGDHNQGPSLSPDPKLKQMKPDGKILLKLFWFQTFVFMVCCHDVRICQGVRQHRACQKSSGGLFWLQGTKPGTGCVHTLDQ